MENERESDAAQIACHWDLGSGEQIDLEYKHEEAIWLALGPAFAETEVWVKASGRLPVDLRILISRRENALEILLDQGERDRRLWSRENAPRLLVDTDSGLRTITVTAGVGDSAHNHRFYLKKEDAQEP